MGFKIKKPKITISKKTLKSAGALGAIAASDQGSKLLGNLPSAQMVGFGGPEKPKKIVNGIDMSHYESGGQQITATNGLQAVKGGTNIMGVDRPDQYLMRNADNSLNSAFAENVGQSTQKLRDYGNTFGGDVDARAKVDMGDAYNKMQSQAMGSGDLEQTALMRGQLNNKLGTDLSNANRQSMNNLSQTQSQMAMRGGVSGGSLERMGRMNNRDNLMANQGIMSQNRDQNLQLSIENANTRNNMLRDVGQVQQNNINSNASAFTNNQNRQLDALTKAGIVEQDVQKSNVNAVRGDLDSQNSAASNFYNQDMSAMGASKTADAQRKASQPQSGCCFIFLEARYGNGVMDKVVRRFRDEQLTAKNQRGYYKLSEVLVPLMRKYKAVKLATRLFMTDPMVAYGKAYYGGNKLGLIFKPVVKFWTGIFDYLGSDHEFIRENGQTV